MNSEFNLEALIKVFRWPFKSFSLDEFAAIIKNTRRFIDFDETIYDNNQKRPFELLCGKPLIDFLREEPFIIQTWNPNAAINFFERSPKLPQPLLVIEPPSVFLTHEPIWSEELNKLITWTLAKNFEEFGFKDKIIIDDFVSGRGIHAPGCTLIAPR